MMKQTNRHSTTRGFSRAATLMQSRIRAASEGRGFAQTRILTHWAEIVGDEIAKTTQPVNISYSKGGMGATLTLLTSGAMAPMVEMQKPQILEKVNACYGYRAVARLRITQTAQTGFAEGRAIFGHAPVAKPAQADPAIAKAASEVADGVTNDDLRQALETLARNVLSRTTSKPEV